MGYMRPPKPQRSLTKGTSTAVVRFTWLDPGKWDGLAILTCHNVTEMIPKVACMTNGHRVKLGTERYMKHSNWKERQLFWVLHCNYTTKKTNLKLIFQHMASSRAGWRFMVCFSAIKKEGKFCFKAKTDFPKVRQMVHGTSFSPKLLRCGS